MVKEEVTGCACAPARVKAKKLAAASFFGHCEIKFRITDGIQQDGT